MSLSLDLFDGDIDEEVALILALRQEQDDEEQHIGYLPSEMCNWMRSDDPYCEDDDIEYDECSICSRQRCCCKNVYDFSVTKKNNRKCGEKRGEILTTPPPLTSVSNHEAHKAAIIVDEDKIALRNLAKCNMPYWNFINRYSIKDVLSIAKKEKYVSKEKRSRRKKRILLLE